MKSFISEFKEFIARGNVIDMSVGIVIGSAFTAIINSLVNDIITPFIGLFIGGIDFSHLYITFGKGEYAAKLMYGNFISAVIQFLMVAFVIFCVVKAMNKLAQKAAPEEKDSEKLSITICPYCKTEIDALATRCPNCTSEL